MVELGKSYFAYLLVLIILAQVAFLGMAHAAATSAFINANFDSDASVTSIPVVAAGANYTLILANGTETYLLDSQSTPVLDAAKAAQILTDDIYAKAGYDSKVANLKAGMDTFEQARAINESLCRQYTGSDNHPCTDAESCKIACQASPLCQGSFYNAPNYIDYALSWQLNSSDLTSKISAFNASADGLKSGSSAVAAQLAALDGIQSDIGAINSNMIFLRVVDENGYEFCPKIDFSNQTLATIRNDLNSLKTSLAPLATVSARASALVAASNAQSDYIKNRPAKFSSLLGKVEQESAQLRSKYNTANAKMSLSGMEQSVIELENMSANISALGQQGKYAHAFALEQTFDMKYSDADGSLNSAQNKFKAAQNMSASLAAKIAQAQGAFKGADAQSSLADMSANLSGTQTALNKKPTLAQLEGANSQLAAISTQLNDLVASQALSGASPSPVSTGGSEMDLAKATIGGIPVLFVGAGAIALLVLVAVAFFVLGRKGGSKGQKQQAKK